MPDRQSFGEAALERAKLFVYRLDKKAVLNPEGVCDAKPIPVPQYVPSSLGSSTTSTTSTPRFASTFSISKRFSSRVSHSERRKRGLAWPTRQSDIPVEKRVTVPDDGDGGGTVGSSGDGDDGDGGDDGDDGVDERVCRLERKVASLTLELKQLAKHLQALDA